MRQISSTLLAAQNFEQTINDSAARIPHVVLEFYSKDYSTVYDYSDRSLGIEHHIEPTAGYATILLRNNDDVVEDIKGYWVEIVYGDKFFDNDGVITGHDGYFTPRLWVKTQMTTSSPNSKMVILELEGQWEKLGGNLCLMDKVAPYHFGHWVDTTPFDILYFVLREAGMYRVDLAPGQDDGIINTITPDFYINQPMLTRNWDGEVMPDSLVSKPRYETNRDIVEKLIAPTKSYLRAVSGTPAGSPHFEVVFPQEEDEVNETYYSYKAPWFYEFVYRKDVTVPNHFFIYGDINDETGLFYDPLLIGHALDQEAIDAYAEVVDISVNGGVRTQADIDLMAEALLSKQQAKSKGGRLITPFDVRVELFDRVEVEDNR